MDVASNIIYREIEYFVDHNEERGRVIPQDILSQYKAARRTCHLRKGRNIMFFKSSVGVIWTSILEVGHKVTPVTIYPLQCIDGQSRLDIIKDKIERLRRTGYVANRSMIVGRVN